MKPKVDLHSLIVFFALGLTAILLSSCNPAPKYARPPAQTPTAYKESAPQQYKEGTGWKVAQPDDDKIRGNWWEIYNDPVLNSLEQQVKISNQNFKASEAVYRQAQALVISAHAAWFPVVTTSPSYSNAGFSQTAKGSRVVASGGSGTTGVGGGAGTTSLNDYSLPFTVSYVFDFWHRIRNTIAENAFNAQASAGDLATALLSYQSTLAQDYFEVRALDAQRKILQDTVASYRNTLDLTKTLFENGIDSEEDVAQAQTQLNTAIAQSTDLGVARAQYEHAIATLIGKPAAEFSLAPAAFSPNPPSVPVALPSELLERRPDIAAAERRVAAANAAIGIARAAYYPNVTLSASGGFQTASISQWFEWPSKFWSIGPNISETLFDAGARRAVVEQQQGVYDEAVATYRQTVLSAFQAVEDNLASLRILAEEVQEQHRAVGSSSNYLDLALYRYKAGIDSYLNVMTAQTSVLTNRETEVSIELRQMTASVSLVMALGGGWNLAELPNMKQMTTQPPKWKPASATAAGPQGQPASPNPPSLP